MASPVPKHLREDGEYLGIPPHLLAHVTDVAVDSTKGVGVIGTARRMAKYAPGLASALMEFARSRSVGDPMAGTGTLARETGINVALNDIDLGMSEFLSPLAAKGCEVSYLPATQIAWRRDVCIFSPPYYPRTDRKVANAHDDSKRGPVVGFRDSYSCQHPELIGNPGDVGALLRYHDQMTAVYLHLMAVCDRMIVVTKNWTRLGTELRLDLDTILMAQSVGWECFERHGWKPTVSLWSRYNAQRGSSVQIEDILVFRKAKKAER